VTLTFRVVLKRDAREALARDPALAGELDPSALVLELDADDPRLHRLLETTRHTAGVWLNPIMTFTSAELAAVKFLQVDCRGKIVRETSADNEANRSIVDRLAFHSERGRVLPIKLLDRITLTKVPLAPNAIGCATDWTLEFIVPRAVADVFRDEGLTGFELRPVVDAKGREHDDFFLLYSSSIMPDAQRDATTLDQRHTDAPGWRELGVLTYEFSGPPEGGPLRDFNRTAENWASNNLPLWIVSQRVRDVVARRGLKGWGYRPVLERGTALHQTYLRLWSDALERVAVNPRNTF